MEPGKGADGLIALRAKIASAGVISALAIAAVLACSGCGGDSGDEPTASTAGSGASKDQGAGSGSTTTSPADKEGGGAATPGDSPTADAKPPSSSPSAKPSPGGAKQGAKVQLPEGEPEPTATPAEEAQATVTDIALTMPALGSSSEEVPTLPAAYTCDGPDSWPALEWEGVPAESKELVLFAMNVAPVQGKLFFDWAIAGLDPKLKGIGAKERPFGSVMGQNSYNRLGYSVCPPKGQTETCYRY